MSLINQMLRDLEKRNSTNNTPPLLQSTIHVTQSPKSKSHFLPWSALTLAVTIGIYWAYKNNPTLIKTHRPATADNATIGSASTPIAPYEKVLSAPNVIIDAASKNDRKKPDHSTDQSPPEALPHSTSQTNIAPSSESIARPKVAAAQQSAQTVPPTPKAASESPTHQAPAVPKSTAPKQTNKQIADSLYRQVEKNPENFTAISKLEQVLELDPQHLNARLLLAKALHNQGHTAKTAEFLDQSLALFPDNLQFINTRAQLFLQQKNPNGALRILLHADLENSFNETYLSLLAATYQQLQLFANSAKVYQKLVSINPEKAENWLGLGLSQEKLGNLKLAYDAYQQALHKNTLKESVADYIRQRLMEIK